MDQGTVDRIARITREEGSGAREWDNDQVTVFTAYPLDTADALLREGFAVQLVDGGVIVKEEL